MRRCLNLVAVAPDRATARGWAAALRGLPEVRRVTTADALVPAEQDEKLALLEDLELLLGPGFGELERAPRRSRRRWRPRWPRSKRRAPTKPAARALRDAAAACASGSPAGDAQRPDRRCARLDER